MTAIKIANLLRAIADALAGEESHCSDDIKNVMDTMPSFQKPTKQKPELQREDAAEINVFEVESSCCGDKVIQKGECYECMKCGDICQTQPKGGVETAGTEEARLRTEGKTLLRIARAVAQARMHGRDRGGRIRMRRLFQAIQRCARA